MNHREIKNFNYAEWIQNGDEKCIFDANQMASQNSKMIFLMTTFVEDSPHREALFQEMNTLFIMNFEVRRDIVGAVYRLGYKEMPSPPCLVFFDREKEAPQRF